MPNLARDRKYYRKSFTQGLEVFLAKRIAGNSWVVLLPDLTFGAVTLSARSTIGSEPGEGTQWTRMPLLTEAQKVDNLNKATDLIAHGVSSSLELRPDPLPAGTPSPPGFRRTGRPDRFAVAIARCAVAALGLADAPALSRVGCSSRAALLRVRQLRGHRGRLRHRELHPRLLLPRELSSGLSKRATLPGRSRQTLSGSRIGINSSPSTFPSGRVYSSSRASLS